MPRVAPRRSSAVSLRPIRASEVEAVRRLVQLYIYDLGGAYWDVEPNGAFAHASWHRRFWTGRGRRLFVLRVRGRLAGFVLVRDRAHYAGRGVREISEFFVLRKYRRRGIGTRAALALFRGLAGRWELAELTWNVPAQRFWRRVIRQVAVAGFTEQRRRNGDLPFFVQHFDTAATGRRVRRASPRRRRRTA
jgi:predicted acetyltransferase